MERLEKFKPLYKTQKMCIEAQLHTEHTPFLLKFVQQFRIHMNRKKMAGGKMITCAKIPDVFHIKIQSQGLGVTLFDKINFFRQLAGHVQYRISAAESQFNIPHTSQEHYRQHGSDQRTTGNV